MERLGGDLLWLGKKVGADEVDKEHNNVPSMMSLTSTPSCHRMPLLALYATSEL